MPGRGLKEWGWPKGVGKRKNEEQVCATYNAKGSTGDGADWLVMVTYSDFSAGCCTSLNFVLLRC